MAVVPECVERRQGHVPLGGALARAVVQVAQPVGLLAALGEGRLGAQPPRQTAEDIVIVAGLAEGLDGLPPATPPTTRPPPSTPRAPRRPT